MQWYYQNAFDMCNQFTDLYNTVMYNGYDKLYDHEYLLNEIFLKMREGLFIKTDFIYFKKFDANLKRINIKYSRG